MKTEKEKMLAGEPYFAFDDVLTKERLFAKKLLHSFNHLHPAEIDERNSIIKNLFGKIGENFIIESPLRCDYGYNVEIGKNFYANYNCVILDCAKVTIGDNVLFAPNVSVFTAGHPISAQKRKEGWEYAFPVTIGNDVWIGGNTVVNPGVNIGNNVVIGSGSVVTKDIPDNSVAVGNPCKVIRPITEKDELFYFKDKRF